MALESQNPGSPDHAISRLREFIAGGNLYANGFVAIGVARASLEILCSVARERVANKDDVSASPNLPCTDDPFLQLFFARDPDIEQYIERANASLESLIDAALSRNAAAAVTMLEKYAVHGACFPNAVQAIRYTKEAFTDAMQLGFHCTANIHALTERVFDLLDMIVKREGYVLQRVGWQITLEKDRQIFKV